MIHDSTHLGTSDTETWRAVPAEINPSGDELGAWAVVAGDGEEADVYLQVTAEYPRRVAEFVAAAARAEAAGRRFAGATGDIAAELDRQQRSSGPADQRGTAGAAYLPDPLRLAMLVEHVGEVAREVADGGGRCRDEAAKHLYASLTQVAATAVSWMEAVQARGLPGTETHAHEETN
ncbi:hypothetical protein [Spirillospora sp. NPDC048823]|uniref:hypothetical protein n=1 Tax=unclassified Spirillospora TaxID=2642701 RepID=UPI003713006A